MSYYSDVVNSMHSVETLTGAGAVSVVTSATLLVTTSTDALTLAVAQAGQLKFICMQTDGGTGTLTPTAGTLSGYTTIAFADVGDWVILKFNGLQWEVKASRGVTLA